MRISFDANYCLFEKSGIGHYALRLFKSVQEHCGSHKCLLYHTKPLLFSRKGFAAKASYVLWMNSVLPLLLAKDKAGVLVSTNYLKPCALPKNCKSIVVFHDTAFHCFPEFFERKANACMNFLVKKCSMNADAYIVPSQATKKSVVECFHIDAGKVFVVPHGVGEEFKKLPLQEVESFRKEKKLPEKFILFVGVLEKRKNLVTVLNAFAELKKKGLEHKLVLVGKQGFGFREIENSVKENGLEKEVIMTGYVEGREPPLYYNAADAFVFPGLCEGFGFPVLEAMACGVPVISSNAFSLPEVLGNAGVLVEPLATKQWANAIEKAVLDEKHRQTLAKRGLKRAKEFSWKKTAEQTLKVTESL